MYIHDLQLRLHYPISFGCLRSSTLLLRIFKWTHFNQDSLPFLPLIPAPPFFWALWEMKRLWSLHFFFSRVYWLDLWKVTIYTIDRAILYSFSIYSICRLNKKLTATKEREIWENWKGNEKYFNFIYVTHYFLAKNVCNGHCSMVRVHTRSSLRALAVLSFNT